MLLKAFLRTQYSIPFTETPQLIGLPHPSRLFISITAHKVPPDSDSALYQRLL